MRVHVLFSDGEPVLLTAAGVSVGRARCPEGGQNPHLRWDDPQTLGIEMSSVISQRRKQLTRTRKANQGHLCDHPRRACFITSHWRGRLWGAGRIWQGVHPAAGSSRARFLPQGACRHTDLTLGSATQEHCDLGQVTTAGPLSYANTHSIAFPQGTPTPVPSTPHPQPEPLQSWGPGKVILPLRTRLENRNQSGLAHALAPARPGRVGKGVSPSLRAEAEAELGSPEQRLFLFS